MPTPSVWDAIDQTDGTPGNAFEMLIDVAFAATPLIFTNIPDKTNLQITPTEKSRVRQTDAAKGVERASAYARSFAVSFDHEVVRKEDNTYIDTLQELIEAGRSLGADNRRRFRIYDGLGADEAIEGVFGVAYPQRSGTGWDDAAYKTINLTQFGEVEYIPNPALAGLKPIIALVSPLEGAKAGATVYIQGANLGRVVKTTSSNVSFGGVDASSFAVVSDTLITAVVPAGPVGPADLAVHNPDGTTTVPFTRLAA